MYKIPFIYILHITPVVQGGIEGIGLFNSAPFDTHTIVYAKYCDGGSWTGQLSNPPIVAGNPAIKLFFRGTMASSPFFWTRFCDCAVTVL